MTELDAAAATRTLVRVCHGDARRAGWWTDLDDGQPTTRNFAECIALIHSELSEALEGARKNLTDEHIKDMPSVTVELADALIRICDLAGGYDLDLGTAVGRKLAYNRVRLDHKIENRQKVGGKKF